MTHKKERLLAALLTSRTKKEAAKAAGISERTMRTYFDDPEFRAAYKQAAAGSSTAGARGRHTLTVAARKRKKPEETGRNRKQKGGEAIRHQTKKRPCGPS